MISYDLRCDHLHEFKGWFSSSADFDAQQERGLVTCPVCSSAVIEKCLMAPAIATSRRKEATRDTAINERDQSMVAASQPPSPANMPAEMMAKLKQFKQEVLANTEDVGDRFAEEARKIHYGESDARGVHGKASLNEAKELAEEGIPFLPLPDLPDERN